MQSPSSDGNGNTGPVDKVPLPHHQDIVAPRRIKPEGFRRVRGGRRTRFPRELLYITLAPTSSRELEFQWNKPEAEAVGHIRLITFRAGVVKNVRTEPIEPGFSFAGTVERICPSKSRLWIIADNASRICHLLGLFKELDSGAIELDTPLSTSKGSKGSGDRYNVFAHQFVFGDRCTIISCRLPYGKRFVLVEHANYIKATNKAEFGTVERLDEMQADLLSIKDVITELGVGDWRPTLSALSMSCYKANLPEEPIYSHNTKEAKEIERRSYYGGQIIRYGTGTINQPCHYLDVASMYPFVMSANAFPTKLLSCYYGLNCKPELLSANPLTCIADCRIECNDTLYPVEVDGKTIYATGEFNTTLAGPELAAAIKAGHCVQVFNVAEYRLKSIFREHILKLWDTRLDFEEQGNDTAAKAIKLLMNSLYGKFGQRSSELVYTPSFLPPINWGLHREYYQNNTKHVDFRVCNRAAFRMSERQELSGSIPAIASFVTSYGRQYMSSLRSRVSRGSIYYQGVDALLVDSLGLRDLREVTSKDKPKLGSLRVQHSGTFARILGFNHYRIGNHLVQSGAKDSCYRLNDTTFVDRRYPTLNTSAFVGPDAQYSETIKVVFSEKNHSTQADAPFQKLPLTRLSN